MFLQTLNIISFLVPSLLHCRDILILKSNEAAPAVLSLFKIPQSSSKVQECRKYTWLSLLCDDCRCLNNRMEYICHFIICCWRLSHRFNQCWCFWNFWRQQFSHVEFYLFFFFSRFINSENQEDVSSWFSVYVNWKFQFSDFFIFTF